MSFWDTAKNIGKKIIDNAIETAQLNQQKIGRAYICGSSKSDEALVSCFTHANDAYERAGYAKVLEERGYLEKSSEGKYQRTKKTLNRGL